MRLSRIRCVLDVPCPDRISCRSRSNPLRRRRSHMRHAALAAILLATAACSTRPSDPPATAAAAQGYDLAAQRAKIARIEMRPDAGFLNAEERDVVNYLIQAA